MVRIWIAALAALSCALWSCTVLAQSRPPASAGKDERIARAEAAFRRAGVAFDAGELEAALANYQESYALWPRPRTLLNLGVVLRKLGRGAEAANLLAEYVDSETADPTRLDAVRKALAELDAELGRLVIQAVGDGDVLIDGQLIERARLDRPVRVTPGRHRITQDRDSFEISVPAGKEQEVAVGRVVPPDPPKQAEGPVAVTPDPIVIARPSPRTSRPRFYLWTAGATVVAGGITVFFAERLRDQQRELDAIIAAPQLHEYAEAIAARDRARRTALFTNVGIGVTAAGAIATAALFLLYDPRDGPQAAVSVSDDRGVVLAVSGSW
jgi:tetratricopeptide (TPR) repeat protein